MILAALLLAVQAAAPVRLLPPGDPACGVDRPAMLALDEHAFDDYRTAYGPSCSAPTFRFTK